MKRIGRPPKKPVVDSPTKSSSNPTVSEPISPLNTTPNLPSTLSNLSNEKQLKRKRSSKVHEYLPLSTDQVLEETLNGNEIIAQSCQRLIDAIKAFKLDEERQVAELFLELPDRSEYPDYYKVIDHPISLNQIEKKSSEGVYLKLQDLLADIDVMCKNAMFYNDPKSEIYLDASLIQKFAHEFAETKLTHEKKVKTKAQDVQKMFKAIKESDESTISEMLANGYDVSKLAQTHDLEESFKWSALHCACFHGEKNIIEKLLAAGANIEQPDRLYEGKPLAWAAYGGHLEICKMLVEKYNADVHAKNAHDQGAWDLLSDQTEEWKFLYPTQKERKSSRKSLDSVAKLEPTTVTVSSVTMEKNDMIQKVSSPVFVASPNVIQPVKSPLTLVHGQSPQASDSAKKKRGRPRKSEQRPVDVEMNMNNISQALFQQIDSSKKMAIPSHQFQTPNARSAQSIPNVISAHKRQEIINMPSTQTPMGFSMAQSNIPKPTFPISVKQKPFVSSIGLVSNGNILRQIISTDIYSHSIIAESAVRTLNLRVLLSPKLTDKTCQIIVYHNQNRLMQIKPTTAVKEHEKSSMQDYNSVLSPGLNCFEIFAMVYATQENGKVGYETDQYAIFINKLD